MEIKTLFMGVLLKVKANDYVGYELKAEKYSYYLIGILQGISTFSQHFSKKELEDFIELSIEKIGRTKQGYRISLK